MLNSAVSGNFARYPLYTESVKGLSVKMTTSSKNAECRIVKNATIWWIIMKEVGKGKKWVTHMGKC